MAVARATNGAPTVSARTPSSQRAGSVPRGGAAADGSATGRASKRQPDDGDLDERGPPQAEPADGDMGSA